MVVGSDYHHRGMCVSVCSQTSNKVEWACSRNCPCGSVRADCVHFLYIALCKLILQAIYLCIFWQFTRNVMFHLKTLMSMYIQVVFISLSSVCCSTGIVGRLAAHVRVFDLHSEQCPICTHTKFIPLQPLIEVQVSPQRGVWYTRRTEHH